VRRRIQNTSLASQGNRAKSGVFPICGENADPERMRLGPNLSRKGGKEDSWNGFLDEKGQSHSHGL